MRNYNWIIRSAVVAGLLAAATGAAAQEEDTSATEPGPEELPLSGYIEVGGEYDNNITVDDTDTNSAIGDFRARIRGRIGLDLYDEGDERLTARYSFFQSLHEDLTDFDLQIHGFSLRGKTKWGKTNIGTTYRYDNISLGGSKFQDVHTIRPDIGVLIAKRTYLTAFYEYRSQRFANPLVQERDANRHTLSSRLFFLLGQGRNVTAGYAISRHNAENDAFTYWGHTINATMKYPLGSDEFASVFRLRYRYRIKDFKAVTPSIGDVREDRRHTVRAILEVPFSANWQAQAEYRFVASDSNLAAVDYTSHTVRASLGYSF